MTTTSRPHVLVLGDVAREIALVPDPGHRGHFNRHEGWAGAPTVQAMIREATSDLELLPDYTGLLKTLLADDGSSDDDWGARVTVFDHFPRATGDDKPRLRVREILPARRRPASAGSGGGLKRTRLLQSLKAEPWDSPPADPKTPRLVVLYDGGVNSPFQERWTAAQLGDHVRQRWLIDDRAWLIAALRHSSPESDGTSPSAPSATSVLSSLRQAGGPPAARERTVILLSADNLRAHGLDIVERGTIEQTVRDVVDYVNAATRSGAPPANPSSAVDPLAEAVRVAHHLVLVFEETGVVYLRRQASNWKGSIHFGPNFDRAAQRDPGRYGRAPGKMAVVLTAVVKQTVECLKPGWKEDLDLAPALRLGIAAYNAYFAEGFEVEHPLDSIRKVLGESAKKVVEDTRDTRGDARMLMASLDFTPVFTEKEGQKDWTRITPILTPKPALAELIIQRGVDEAFREPKDESASSYPSALIGCPYARFGKLRTVDHVEIARFVSLGNLIHKYLQDPAWRQPLSLAVFGPPGAGKGYAVKEIFRSVSGDPKEEPLAYNLAQFTSAQQLGDAFHQIRDRALATGRVPLVMFDEFDSTLEQQWMGWLKYFLAPMQDGTFRGPGGEYLVGRCILLFAGGTAETFAQFTKAAPPDEKDRRKAAPTAGDGPTAARAAEETTGSARKAAQEVEKAAELARKAAKLPDFASRIKGHLDVESINYDASEPGRDPMVRVKRAMLFRSLLEDHAKPILEKRAAGSYAHVHDDIVRAMLSKQTCFHHGVRSMESLIRMARWINGEFVVASLPSEEQRNVHVDLDLSGKPEEPAETPRPAG